MHNKDLRLHAHVIPVRDAAYLETLLSERCKMIAEELSADNRLCPVMLVSVKHPGKFILLAPLALEAAKSPKE